MAHLLSGRVKLKKGSQLGTGRTNFLNLDEAEPNLGSPQEDGHILASDANGNRYWVDPVAIQSSTRLTQLFDVDPTGLKDKSIPIYDANSGKFKLTETKFDITDGGNF